MSDTPTRLKTIQEGDEGVVERAAHALKKGELREHGRIAEIRDELQRPAVRETLLELRNCSTGLKPNSTALVPSWSGRWARVQRLKRKKFLAYRHNAPADCDRSETLLDRR